MEIELNYALIDVRLRAVRLKRGDTQRVFGREFKEGFAKKESPSLTKDKKHV